MNFEIHIVNLGSWDGELIWRTRTAKEKLVVFLHERWEQKKRQELLSLIKQEKHER